MSRDNFSARIELRLSYVGVNELMRRFSFRFFLVSSLLLLGASAVDAQSSRPAPSPPMPPINSEPDRPERHDFGADPEEDMRVRLAIKADQKQHEETLVRAREASDLGTELLDAYKQNKALNVDEAKKLERLEKLVKRIRNDAGGLNKEEQTGDLPGTLETLIKRLADLTSELRKDVEKTPRHVVSAVVIDRANDLIGLIQHVRKLVQ